MANIDRRKISLKWKNVISLVRAVIGASRNTNPYGKVGSLERNNVVRVCQLTQEISERKRYAFTPASFDQIYVEAKKLDAF